MSGPKLTLLLALAAAAGGTAVWVGVQYFQSPPESAVNSETAETEQIETLGVVELDAAAQDRAGIVVATPTPETVRPELIAYGRLEEEPSRAFTVRAPLAGTLLPLDTAEWPVIGQTIPDDGVVGLIEPRLSAAEKISLTNQLNQANAELQASQSAAQVAEAALKRARILNADRKNVSDRVLQEAESRWTAESSRLSAAQESVRLLEESLRATGPGGRSELTAIRGGEVVQVMAQPGEAIESGQPVVRLARFDQLLARVALPVGQDAPPDVMRASIEVVGFDNRRFSAERVAFSSAVDPATQSTSLVFRLTQPESVGLRPGLALTAHIPLPGDARRGYFVPRSAVVQFGGQYYVYVEVEPGRFARRDIDPIEPSGDGYFTTVLQENEPIVVNGAQALLSEENKSGIAVEGE